MYYNYYSYYYIIKAFSLSTFTFNFRRRKSIVKPILDAGERRWHVVTTREFADKCHRLLLSNYSTVILAKLERQILYNVCARLTICINTTKNAI